VPSQPPRPGCRDTNEVEDTRGPTVVWPAGCRHRTESTSRPTSALRAPWSILPFEVVAIGTRRQRRADVSPHERALRTAIIEAAVH